jgi:peptidoglycan/LPS O-acetylase OafA/YrhL
MALTTNLTYTDIMVGGLWTLPLEVQMYIALPFRFLLGRMRGWRDMASLWIASLALAIVQIETGHGRLNVLGYAPCFIGGVLGWKLSLTARRNLPGCDLYPEIRTGIN